MLPIRRLPWLAVLLLSLAACSSSQPQGSSPPQGSVQFAASLQQSLSASDVARVKVTVSASDMTSMVVDLAQSNNSWGGSINNIPSGLNRSFLAEAFDSSGTVRFQGQTSGVAINPNQTTAVAITLQELASTPPYSNEAPLIDSLVASPTTVQTGDSLPLTAAVHDPNAGDTLTLAWSATGGTFSAPTTAASSWTAPSTVGVQTLTLTVTDSQGVAVSVSVAINVVSGAPTNANLSISFNLLPVVSKLSASLSRLDAGQSTTVSATTSDADGDSLTYQWTAAASCPGTWTNATSSSASFVPSSVPAGVCNNCQLTITVKDGHGGQTTGSLNLCVAKATTERFPPRFTNFQPSVSSLSPGQTVTFDVTTMDPQSSSLTFAWSTNTGVLAAAQNTATTSHVSWTAPSCAVTGVIPTVTATVTNAYGLSASLPFTLSGLPACATGWAAAGTLSASRTEHTATLLNSGKVLITGGSEGGAFSASVALYDPALRTSSPAASMPSIREEHTAALLPNGKVLVAGGYDGSYHADAWLYDPASGSWSTTVSLTSARGYHTATRLNNGKVLFSGMGWGSPVSMELYDPALGTWSAAAPMPTGRYNHTATLLNNGKVLFSGGYTNGNGSASTAVVEMYDPASNTWSTTAPMATARGAHTATLLTSGKVLVTGGYSGGSYLASAEVYDPASGTWSAAASMTSVRAEHTATLLNNGQVLVLGGSNGSPLASAELYTP